MAVMHQKGAREGHGSSSENEISELRSAGAHYTPFVSSTGERGKGETSCYLPFVGFPDSSVGKESSCNAGDPGWSPGSG